MSNKLIRKKPGYTKSGGIKIISLSVKQLVDLMDKTQQNKRRAKIQRRISLLKARPGYQEPVVESISETATEVTE
jgi:putative component of toxin-antitoxin plasmid stabilization module